MNLQTKLRDTIETYLLNDKHLSSTQIQISELRKIITQHHGWIRDFFSPVDLIEAYRLLVKFNNLRENEIYLHLKLFVLIQTIPVRPFNNQLKIKIT